MDHVIEQISDQSDEIRRWHDTLPKSCDILFLKTDDARSKQFETFCEAFHHHAPRVVFKTERGEDENYPALLIQESWRYHLIPTGAELNPFMTLLSLIQRDEAEVDHDLRRMLEKVQYPADVKIYVTTQCPHCKETVARILPLPLINPVLQITLIDGMLFPELAAADKIHAAPTVICDGRFRWTGQMQPEEMIHVMVHRHPGDLGADIFKRMIKEGDASHLADLMLQTGEIFPAFVDLLAHEKWPIRLGAMVALEGLVETDLKLAKEAIQPLWEKMNGAEVQVRGDIIYWVGELGDETWIPQLERMRGEENSEDVVEAIDEALEKLRA